MSRKRLHNFALLSGTDINTAESSPWQHPHIPSDPHPIRITVSFTSVDRASNRAQPPRFHFRVHPQTHCTRYGSIEAGRERAASTMSVNAMVAATLNSPSFKRFPILSTHSSTYAKRSLDIASSQAFRKDSSLDLAASATEANCLQNTSAATLLAGRGTEDRALKNVSAGPSASVGPSYAITLMSSDCVGRQASNFSRSSLLRSSASTGKFNRDEATFEVRFRRSTGDHSDWD